MNAGALTRLVRLSLSRDKRGALFSAFGVAVGVGALVFFVALGLGISKVVTEKVFPVDAALVDVIPPQISLGSILGGGKLDQPTVDRLAALDGVAEVYRKMNVRVPAVSRYDGEFFGSRIRMGLEILAVGVDPGLVRKDVQLGDFTDPGANQPIPALASTRLLELYNKTFAPARKLPQIAPQMIAGFQFPVEFNRSFVAQAAPGPSIPAQAQIVGVSDHAMLAGITIPLDAAIRLNKATNQDAETFTGVTLRMKDPSRVPRVVAQIKEMGFEIDDSERQNAEKYGSVVALVTTAFALLSVLICLLAAVNIAHALNASIRARAKEIGVMQAVGASRSDIRNIILGEAATVGLLGGIAGTVLAILTALLLDKFSGSYLPPFPFKPESFFAFPPHVWLGGVVIGVVAALVGAFFPSRRAAAMDPARTLAG